MTSTKSTPALTLISPQSRQRLSSVEEMRHKTVIMNRNNSLLSMDPSKDPTNRIQTDGLYLEPTATTSDTVTIDWYYCAAKTWNPVNHFLLEHSSVIDPTFVYERKALNERRFILRGCTAGTKYFFVISAIDSYGKVIIRSQNLTVQTSARIDRPVLTLKKALADKISIGWNEPIEHGDGHISEYHLSVNGEYYTTISKHHRSYDYIQCAPLQHFTFRIQAISIRHECHSEWSNVLDITCPAVLPITLTRMRPKTKNTIQVKWNMPTCVGFAKVKEFKLYYKEFSKDKNYNDQIIPDADKIIGHRHSIMRSYKPEKTTSTINGIAPDKWYWVILRADVLPEGCPVVTSAPIKIRATIRPIPPEIKITIYGQKERSELNRKIAVLLDKRDKIKRRKDIFRSSDIVKGAELKNEEEKKMNVLLYEIEQQLHELTRIVNKFTGFVPVVIDWDAPNFDEFSEPLSYQINVDNHSYQQPLSLETTQHSLKLDVEKDTHSISLTTLSWHPVGHSDKSNEEIVQAKEFRPNRFFCYFSTHKNNVSWPGKGACRLEDCLAQESKLTSKNNVHRGLLKTRTTPKPFRVLGVHDATWQSLIRHFGAKKPTIILFWTKWCISSQNMLEKFSNFAYQMKDKYLYLACCVKSGEDFLTHRKSVIELLNRKNLRTVGNIRHCCACHPAPALPNDTVQKMDNASIPSSFDLVGVPTIVVLDVKGQLSWQGRVSADTNETFFSCMTHAMSQVEERQCPITECEHCKDDEAITHETKERNELKKDENKLEISQPGSKFTLDEFHLLHSKLHGKALGDVEKTQDESYAKIDSISPRKSWRERRQANKMKAEDEKQVRFVDVKGEQPQQINEDTTKQMYGATQLNRTPRGREYELSTTSPRNQQEEMFEIGEQHQLRKMTDGEKVQNGHYPDIGNRNGGTYHDHLNHHDNEKPKVRFADTNKKDFRTYQYREPKREYRSPNNGYQKGKHGYGSIQTITKPSTDNISSTPTSNENNTEDRKPGYRYSSVNYHAASRVFTDGNEVDDTDHDHTDNMVQNKSINLGYHTGRKSAIKAYSVNRDSSRSNDMSSTWPRAAFAKDDDEYEFMKPSYQRAKENNGLYNSNGEVNKETVRSSYTYIKPSTATTLEDIERSKLERNKGKYSHIKSRYAVDIYKPPRSAKRKSLPMSARKHSSRVSGSTKGLARGTKSASSSPRKNNR